MNYTRTSFVAALGAGALLVLTFVLAVAADFLPAGFHATGAMLGVAALATFFAGIGVAFMAIVGMIR